MEILLQPLPHFVMWPRLLLASGRNPSVHPKAEGMPDYSHGLESVGQDQNCSIHGNELELSSSFVLMQDLAVFLIFAVAVAFLVRHWFFAKDKGSCGGCKSCPSSAKKEGEPHLIQIDLGPLRK